MHRIASRLDSHKIVNHPLQHPSPHKMLRQMQVTFLWTLALSFPKTNTIGAQKTPECPVQAGPREAGAQGRREPQDSPVPPWHHLQPDCTPHYLPVSTFNIVTDTLPRSSKMPSATSTPCARCTPSASTRRTLSTPSKTPAR
jgi:hypothetical protein